MSGCRTSCAFSIFALVCFKTTRRIVSGIGPLTPMAKGKGVRLANHSMRIANKGQKGGYTQWLHREFEDEHGNGDAIVRGSQRPVTANAPMTQRDPHRDWAPVPLAPGPGPSRSR